MKPIIAALALSLLSTVAFAGNDSDDIARHRHELREDCAWLEAHPNANGHHARHARHEVAEEKAWLAKHGIDADCCPRPAPSCPKECDEECVIPKKPCGHYQEVEVTRTLKGYYTTEYDVCRTPGYYVSHNETACVCPETCEKIPVPPQFKTEVDCTGKEIQIMTVCPSFREVKHPAKYETKCVKTYCKGTCKVTPRQVWHEGTSDTKCERIWVKD